MRSSIRHRQRGLSVFGMLLLAVLIGLVGVLVSQIAPTFIEYLAIGRAVDKAKAGNTVSEVRQIFAKAAEVDGITSITSKELDISKSDADVVVVSFSYQREFHLAGPAWLVLRYSGRSK